MRFGLVLLLMLAAPCARAGISEPPAAIESELAPGAFEELCFELDAGQAVRYQFDAGAPLDFNLHWHRGNEVLFPIRSSAVARRAGVFAAGERQAYCLMWTNRGRGAVLLRARIDRAD
jgi:hypothetical protein